jgi:hypothetical protein
VASGAGDDQVGALFLGDLGDRVSSTADHALRDPQPRAATQLAAP